MPFYFVQPIALLLLLAIPFFVYRWRRLQGLSPVRKWIALGLRLLVALLLILCLARLQFRGHSDLLSVIFALDLSESVPDLQRAEAYQTVREAAAEMDKNDRAGVVVFGKEAVLDVPVQPFLMWDRPSSLYQDEATNLAAALRLSLAAFPVESQKRIVLLSDGNENRGAGIDESRKLAGLGTPVDVIPLEYRNEAEVYVEKMVHPNIVSEDEPLDIDLFVRSSRETPARLRLFLENRLIREQPVALREGKNKFSVNSLKIPGGALSKLEVRVEAEADTNFENNRASGYVNVVGKPLALLVEGDLSTNPAAGEEFVGHLQSEGIRVRRISPAELSGDPAEILSVDVVVLSNVHASDLSDSQMEAIERGVHDMGVGLVMVGGPESFGAGAYKGTPIEKALPVRMDITDRKIIPSGALALVLHTCEIQMGNDWMRKIAIESIRVLEPNDEVGMLDYEGGGVQWIFPLGPRGDARAQIARIKSARPGDMPDFAPAMKLGLNGLKQASSNLRHMVILSDGDPSPPSTALLRDFAANGISISTVLIGGHGMNFRGVMSKIAKTTGGRFYDVQNPARLPRIFSREAARIKRNLVMEEPFQPRQVADTELTESFDPEAFPSLLGCVLTSPKSGAETPLLTHQEDPLLAHWRYGLGRSVAFTSDFKKRWGPNWIEWEGYGRFWAQTIRWVSRQKMDGDYRLSVFREEGKGRVVLDVFDESGAALNYLSFAGRVIAPGNEAAEVRLVQTDLGRYEADFDLDDEGTYLVSLFRADEESEGSGIISAGLAVPYSPEFSDDRSNLPLLEGIAATTGGRFKPDTASLFDHSLIAHAKPIPLWPWLLPASAILFWWDIFTRRVLIDWYDVRNGTAAALRFLAPKKKETASETLDRLKELKSSTVEKTIDPTPERRFDFDALEGRSVEDVDLSKPEGRKAAPAKRETDVAPSSAKDSGGPGTTKRLLDLKKRMKD